MVLQPQNSFTVVRQIANHLDTGTYYVRAVIRNAYTDELIKNLDLTNKGGQRFSKNWQVPADPSGQGFYISIVTSVYTDSNYTTKSSDYGDEAATYLVQDRIGNLSKGGGGLDIRTTRRIIKEELAKIKFPEQKKIEIPENKIDLIPILKEIGSLKEKISLLPKPVKTDLTPIKNKLDKISKEIEEKEVTPETDLSKIIEIIKDNDENQELSKQEIKEILIQLEKSINKKMKDFVKEIKSSMKKTKFKIETLKASVDDEEEKEEPIPFNINNLAK